MRHTELSYDPAVPLWTSYPKEKRSLGQIDTCTFFFIAGVFTIAKVWSQPECPSPGEWSFNIACNTVACYSAIKIHELSKQKQT